MRRDGHSVYLRHTSLVFCAAALVALLLTPIYQSVHENARQNLIQAIDWQVRQGLTDFADYTEELMGTLYELRYDTGLIALSVSDDAALRRSNYLPLYTFQSSLQKSRRYGMMDDLLTIQFGRNSLFFLGQRGFTDREAAYGTNFYYYQGMDYQEYQAYLQRREVFWPARNVYMHEHGLQECLTFNQYYGPVSAPSVIISALIPTRPLFEAVLSHENSEEMLAVFSGPDGQVLCSRGEAEACQAMNTEAASMRFDGEDYRLFRHKAMPSGISVVVGVPEHLFAESVRPVKQKITLMLLLALLGAVAYAALYSYIHFRPLVSLMDFLGPEARPRNLYAQLQGALSSMSLAGEHLNRDYRRAMRQIRANAFKNACLGAPLSEEERSCLDSYPLFGQDCILAALSLPGQDSALQFTLAQAVFEEFFPQSQVYHAPWLCAVLPVSDSAGLTQGLQRVREKLSREVDGQIFMGLSLKFRGAEGLSQAAMQAREALFETGPEGACLSFHPVDRAPRSFPPFQQYLELTDAMLNGAESRVAELFQGFQARLSGERMEPQQVRQMLNNLSDVVGAAVERLPGEIEPFAPPQEDVYPPEYLKSMGEFAVGLAQSLNRRREALREGQIQQMMAFIEENFRDPNMSLSVVAQHFSISEGYVSQYIKRCTGKNYSAHLEELRMNEAMRLLTQTQLPIGEIVKKSGFEYKNTFYKAFKKHFGVPPNTFREERRE